MKNGDRYTCEIVGLSQGQLKVKTVNTTGSVLLDWARVDRIQSTQFFAVELSDGSNLAGIIEKVPDTEALNDFRVTAGGKTTFVSGAAVVSIARSGRRLKGRLSGAVSAGFNYTKGNSTKQYNLSGSVTARSRTQEFTPAVSSTFSSQSEASSTRRNDISFQYWKALSRNWLIGSYNDFLRSDQQQLDLRATFGGFGARRLVRTNRTNLTLAAGAVFTSEHYRPTDHGAERQKNTEGLIAVRFSMFRFDSTNITAESFLYPSITTPGRLRIDSNVTGKIDLTHSVNVTLSFYSNFDSHPPVQAPRTDAGVNLGLGWSF
jgi:putative salt-induced outer membrane protein YdiY